ncbi:hypothetical protein [Chlamydia gallinacea]|uniref:Uncharacterized protein n=2 Tax=Chlamydia gallinacea TaxID=1457153 RepID=A0A173DXT5_9CHLA|nr:hypothetical protein [Chlamydia gallinacea]EYE60949.1 hypothetical protein M127_5812 [Bacteroides fragilis str. S6L5]ANG65731.1 hypothetical protein M787_000085 [Chlamydia gallinacea 08-1274/3]AQT77204.1 hypothetical protein B1F83_00775 [Chlamydia gallinacea]MBX6680288.1 hypothetical protein [Chlamydia gallinacea]MBX6687590.1 hypothetical protein [Chlamydia gallinacea]
MFKLLKNIFLLAFCIIIYFWIRKESIVEHWLSAKLHTQVSIGRITPRTSGIKIRYLCIHNPIPSERFPYAMEIEYINLRFSLISMLLSKKIEISDLLIHGANFTILPYDTHSSKTNWFLLWKNFIPQGKENATFPPLYSSKLDNIPVLIKRCLFVNTRIHGLKSNNKEVTHFAVPSLEFHSTINKQNSLPDLSSAFAFLLYLAVEESLCHANLPGDIVQPLSQQAHTYFTSSYPMLKDYKTPEIAGNQKSTEEILGFVRELFFH